MRKLAIALIFVAALVDWSCSDASGPGNQANGRISITNDAGVLASRVTYSNDAIPIDSVGVGYPSALAPFGSAAVSRSSAASQAVNLSLKATVAPPSIGGQVLQATSVSIVANSITNQLIFTAEDFRGTIQTNNENNRVIGMTLQFYQIQYPIVLIGAGQYYEFYQMATKITRRALE